MRQGICTATTESREAGNAGRATALLGALLGCCLSAAAAVAAAPTEQQVKAVFVFNFSHFVQWPDEALAGAGQPFDICLFGADELVEEVEEAVRGEQVAGHPLQVRTLQAAAESAGCHLLYLGSSTAAQLEPALAQLPRTGTLTVSDIEGAARRGVMIQLARERNRIRLVINVDAAQAAGLTINSNLLRPAEIVRAEGRD